MGTENGYAAFGAGDEQNRGQPAGGSPSLAATGMDRIAPAVAGYGPNRLFVQRVSVLAWTVAATVAISLFLRLPTVVFTLNALGSPMSIRISETTVIAVFIALLTASGTERAIRTHPLYSGDSSGREPELGGHTWLFWGLPAAVSILAVLLAPEARTPLFQAGAALLSGGLIAIILFNLYASVDQGSAGYRQARILLNVLSYTAALALFLLVYQTRTRSLLSGTLIAATSALLAVELLRDIMPRVNVVLMYAALVAIVLGEAAWALNYWPLSGASGGLVLLLIFYPFVGLARHALHEGHLSRKLVLEYSAFALLALVLIVLIGPGL
ncbi:MAG: hypothetical protein OXI80_09895 [Caldilineaceae bacterium]|nr:hypothetical protein [Caldilineaceae bacterium]MDE0337969.1 hypothetical protein [Caldilineaceae bacterium]